MKKKKGLLVVGILIGVFSLVGISYAAWVKILEQTDENIVSLSCFNVTFTDENPIQLQRAYPMVDEDGKKLSPYTFTIQNNCQELASYQINLEVLNNSTLENYGFIKTMLDEKKPTLLSSNEEVTKTLSNAKTAFKLNEGYLEKGESKSFDLRLWIDESVTLEDNISGQTFLSKVTITSSYLDHIPSDYEVCVGKYGEDSINCTTIANVETTSGKCPAVNEDGIISVNNTENTEGYVCSAPDDYGTSYYYRGVVNNNYVKFGGYYWRILRLNGDGSIRMIYAGDASVIDSLENKEEVLSNGYNDSTTKYKEIGTSRYNYYWKKDNVQESTSSYIGNDNASLGYMYGNRDGVVEASTESDYSSQNKTTTWYYGTEYTYDETRNIFTLSGEVKGVLGSDLTEDVVGLYTCQRTSSTGTCDILRHVTRISLSDTEDYNTIHSKYITYGTTTKEKAQTNTNDSTIKEFLDTWYESHLKDTEYERYLADSYYCNDRSLGSTTDTSYTQLGYGLEKTEYRWYDKSNGVRLTCKEQNDRFTVNDEVIGNKALKYPIGLINTDEAYISGGSYSNNKYYLYTGNHYWTLSPGRYDGNYSIVRLVSSSGHADYMSSINSDYGVRPVINLRANSLKLGSGTINDPWRVE